MIPRDEAAARARELVQGGRALEAAELLLKHGESERALALVRGVLAREPSRSDARMLAGRILLLRGRQGDAAEEFQALCASDPSGDAHLELARCRAGLGDFDAALHHLGEALHLDPSRLDTYETLVHLLWELGKPKAALRFMHQAVAALPVPELRALLARAAVVAREPETARSAMRWLEDHTPISAQRSLALGGIHLALGETEQALKSYREATEQAPGLAETWHALGTALNERDGAEEAIEAFRTALRCQPDYWPSLNDLGLLLLSSGRAAEEAVSLLRRAVQVRPQEAAAHLNLALALLGSGAATAAQRHARAALSLANEPELIAQAADLVRQLTPRTRR